MDYWLTQGGGWEFDRYRRNLPWDEDSARTTQTGNPRLERLRTGSEPAWQQQEGEIRRALDAVLGQMPQSSRSLDSAVLEDQDCGGFRRKKVSYRADEEEAIPAYLLIPAQPPRSPVISNAEAGSGSSLPPAVSLPAMICLHQTVPWGKREPVGLEGDPELAYAKELAEQGFVSLAPDAICFGERYRAGDPYAHYGDAVAFFARHPGWSVMGKMVYDVRRAVDYLQSLPFVDPTRIGCIGHSHGAYGTLFAMLYEPRIRAGVLSCGFTALRSDPSPERWWRLTALIPRLGWFEGRIQDTPFDFHHLLALVAPRPLFVSCALADAVFPNTDHVEEIVGQARRVYGLKGAVDSIALHAFPGPHCFPVDARKQAYAFLQRILNW